MEYIQVGDRVSFVTRKGETITGTITSVKLGRKWSNIDITDDSDKCWGYKTVNDYYSDKGLKFIGKAQTKKLEAAQEKRHELIEKKYENHKKNVDKLHETKAEIGDTIVIRSDRGNWTAEVDKIDYRTGKVGIKRRGSERSEDDFDQISSLFGRKKRVQTHRWISMNCIVEVKKGNGVPSSSVQPLPEKVLRVFDKEIYQTSLKNNGHTQISFSNGEFINDSYAISKQKDEITRLSIYRNVPGLSMYDSSDKTVKFDKEKSLFWINTGSFD